MKKVGRDGIYTGRTIAKVAEWIVKNEESEIFRSGVVCEETRFQDATFDFDRLREPQQSGRQNGLQMERCSIFVKS
jgi:hypothetical protein